MADGWHEDFEDETMPPEMGEVDLEDLVMLDDDSDDGYDWVMVDGYDCDDVVEPWA